MAVEEVAGHRHERRLPLGAVLLGALLVVDLGLIALHLSHTLAGAGTYGQWSLAADGGWGELYQYLKWSWLSLGLVVLAWVGREWRWLPLSATFGVLLLTDAFLLHEQLGRRVGIAIDVAVPHVPAVELGGLVVIAAFGAVLVPAVVIAWATSRGRVRDRSSRVIALGAGLVVVGVLVDVAAATFLPVEVKRVWGDLLEDGGEMLLASAMLWVVALEALHALAPTAPRESPVPA
ncbi:hypothetical protein [Agrococcus terreus]|uniref:DUF998 domain-containing protein n=1 Tax=Agrococcus terreus TaxID=574649 RepID=A0ABQ2KJP6_9MICO|nr:hypothetical protein [Agrococcus terreus]GGN84104.1 hypothetical protein GCM10010968_15590 [Agrococcus terreus]